MSLKYKQKKYKKSFIVGCTPLPKPNTKNYCNPSLNDNLYPVPNLCSYPPNDIDLNLAQIGKNVRINVCRSLGGTGEWDWGPNSAIETPCTVDSSEPYRGMNLPICGLPGGQGICTRIGYTASNVDCCFQDYDCTQNNNDCFTGGDEGHTSRTCNPEYRKLTGKKCQEDLLPFCSGNTEEDKENPQSLEWMDRWLNPVSANKSCLYAIQRNVYNIAPDTCNLPPIIDENTPINASGFFWSQEVITAVIAKFTEQGYILGSLPGTPSYHPFQDFLYQNICLPIPGLCQGGLRNVCANYSAQQISFNPNIANWCGCYLPQEEYEAYSVKYNIQPQCTPICNRAGVIPLVGINEQPVVCEQDICLIDNITLNIVNSQVQGGININQVCGNCGPEQNGGISGTCSCVIDNNNIDIVNSVIGGNISLNENCGNITCNQSNPSTIGPNIINVPCDASNNYNPFTQYQQEAAAAQQKAGIWSIIWLIVIIIVALIIIFIIFRYLAVR